MKNTITESQFIDSFAECGRENNFSYEGKKALFNYFEELENDCGIEIENDTIAICCEYTEYEDIEEVSGNYDCIKSIDDLYNNTQVIEFNGSLIIADF